MLFPGYVFVHLDLKDRLRVLQVPSVVRFVSFRGHPAPLPDSEIEALSNGLAGGVRAEPHPLLTAKSRLSTAGWPAVFARNRILFEGWTSRAREIWPLGGGARYPGAQERQVSRGAFHRFDHAFGGS